MYNQVIYIYIHIYIFFLVRYLTDQHFALLLCNNTLSFLFVCFLCWFYFDGRRFRTEGCTMSSMHRLPKLQFHKLSIWPPCAAVFTGGVPGDWGLNPAFRRMSFASFGYSRYLVPSINAHHLFLILTGFSESTGLFAVLLCCNCQDHRAATLPAFHEE